MLLFFITTLFRFTVIDHSFYKKLADNQQRSIERNPTSRGTISSSSDSLNGVVAVSTNLGTLAIDPSQSGSIDGLLDFLSDAVTTEFCLHKPREECIQNIGAYTKVDFTAEKNITEDTLKKWIRTYLQNKIESPVESVLIAENLNDDSINKINALWSEALFFVVNNLYVNPTKVHSPDTLANALAGTLGKNASEILPKFAIRKKQHLEIIRKMNVSTRDMVTNFIKKNKENTDKYVSEAKAKADSTEAKKKAWDDAIAEYAVYPFIKIEDNLVRYYPEGSTLGQITGFVDNEGVGRYGIEGYFENDLQWEAPTQIVTKDSRGKPIRDYASSGALIMQNGVNISLTIDRNIQKEISKRLEKAVKAYKANKWSVIVTDPKTGAIIAMVNYPSYDPNQFTDVYELEPVLYSEYSNPAFELFGLPLYVVDSQSGTISSNIEGKRVKLRAATEDEISNSAVQKYKYKNKFWVGNYQNPIVSNLYEPGSVFKPLTVAIGIDTGEIKPNDTYYDKNVVELDSWGGNIQRIHNIEKSRCGWYHTYGNALNWSCNVGMVNIIEKIGKSLFDSYIHKFWFWAKTDITLDWEVFGQISPYEKWSRLQFFTMSFGQGINMTMLQMASAYNVLANGGIYMQPYIVQSVEYPNGKRIDTVPTPLRRVIKEETSKTITAMMVDWVKGGFAEKGWVTGYSMAGKTGTSQIPYRWTYENIYFHQDLGHTITSYGWYAPAYNPKFVMIAVIDRPRTSVYAEKTAAALYAELSEYLLNYYKVPRWQE